MPLISAWKAIPPKKLFSRQNNQYLVIDIETSGLEAGKDELLSIGWVVIENNKIKLDSAKERLIKPKQSVGNSARIHYLRDCDFAAGISLNDMMTELLSLSKHKTFVFHHASLDMAFLNKASRTVYGIPLLWPSIDTLQIEKNKLERRNIPLKPSILRLASCRLRYNLPSYPAHNALNDALATAELLLAQSVKRG